jgi:hypothetical protein
VAEEHGRRARDHVALSWRAAFFALIDGRSPHLKVWGRLEQSPPAGVPPMSAREGLAARADELPEPSDRKPRPAERGFRLFRDTEHVLDPLQQPLLRPHPDYRAPRQCKGGGS